MAISTVYNNKAELSEEVIEAFKNIALEYHTVNNTWMSFDPIVPVSYGTVSKKAYSSYTLSRRETLMKYGAIRDGTVHISQPYKRKQHQVHPLIFKKRSRFFEILEPSNIHVNTFENGTAFNTQQYRTKIYLQPLSFEKYQ